MEENGTMCRGLCLRRLDWVEQGSAKGKACGRKA
jgi:hypothetical protein